MSEKFKNYLPWICLIAIAIAVGLLFTTSSERTSALKESPETRAKADEVLDKIIAIEPHSLDDNRLASELEQADKTQYIAQVWLFSPDGKLELSRGVPRKAQPADQMATRQVINALNSIPEGTLTQEQQMLLLVSSAIQAEGEHNDVFRYQARVLHSPEGEVVGYVGLTYDVSVSASAAPSLWDMISTIGLLVCLVIYWIGLAVWTYLDAKQRHERAVVWGIFVILGNLVALIAYLLVRNPRS